MSNKKAIIATSEFKLSLNLCEEEIRRKILVDFRLFFLNLIKSFNGEIN